MNKFLNSLGAALVGSICFASFSANATTISINSTTNAQITCTSTVTPALDPACHAFTGGGPFTPGNGVGDPTTTGTLGLTADQYDGVPSGDAFELAQLNILAGTSFSIADHTKGPNGGAPFKTAAEYILFKLSNTAVWIRNLSGGELMFTYTDSICTGPNCIRAGGLSHYSTIGETVIPLPAAVWLMGAGIAGLGFAGRKKKTA